MYTLKQQTADSVFSCCGVIFFRYLLEWFGMAIFCVYKYGFIRCKFVTLPLAVGQGRSRGGERGYGWGSMVSILGAGCFIPQLFIPNQSVFCPSFCFLNKFH